MIQMQGSPCRPATAVLHGCSSPDSGSAEGFGRSHWEQELPSRRRRERMSSQRRHASGHERRAVQLENFLRSQDPSLLSPIFGIFIDHDMHEEVGMRVGPCTSSDTSYPYPQIPGAPPQGRCIFVHGIRNREAYQFNQTTEPFIGQGRRRLRRDEWRLRTLLFFSHEIQHLRFNREDISETGTNSCTRDELARELSELQARLSELRILFRNLPTIGPSRRAGIENFWQNFAITDCGESIAGAILKIRKVCNCSDANTFIIRTFNNLSASWTEAERNYVHQTIHDPRWAPWDMQWPFAHRVP